MTRGEVVGERGSEERGEGDVARQTPYELVFLHSGFEDEVFPGIAEEAAARGVATSSPEPFMLLATVGNALRELMPEGESGAGGPEVRERLEQFGKLLFQAYNFWRYDRYLLLLSGAAARHLVESSPTPPGWDFSPPHPAGYLQLPRNLFWVEAVAGQPPEPADGFFWTMLDMSDPKASSVSRLDILLATGLRRNRPGFSTLSLTAELPDSGPGPWIASEARPGGADFESVLPGGELQSLYSLTTMAEVLKLVSLCFWYATARSAPVLPGSASAGDDATSTHRAAADLPPSQLEYSLLRAPADRAERPAPSDLDRAGHG
jgi:hypothetical protein